MIENSFIGLFKPVFFFFTKNESAPLLNTLYTWSVSLILLSLLLFLIQNVFFSKFLDFLFYKKKKKDRIVNIHRNKLFLYPYSLSLFILYYLFFFRVESRTEALVTLNNQFDIFRGITVPLQFSVDDTSICFIITTMSIGLATNSLMDYYMKNEINQQRFYNLLNCFLFSMILLLLAHNIITLLLFWEFIGLFSYFLINFWNVKPGTFKSATKAMVYNQVSDISLISASVMYFNLKGSLSLPGKFEPLNPLVEGSITYYNFMLFLFFLAASCKSAIFPMHYWLPDSMDAPAPASALIHSATLVASGVFLITKLQPMIIQGSFVTKIFSFLSLFTILVGGLAAASHNDLKKILAYSTVSNCGFMVYFGINAPVDLSTYFFMAHGFLKAASFLTVSMLIIIMGHKQDHRYSTGVSFYRPFLIPSLVISFGGLGALPLSIMQQIKHEVLLNSSMSSTFNNIEDLFINLGILTSVIYSLKVINSIVCGGYKKKKIKTSGYIVNIEYNSSSFLISFVMQSVIILYFIYYFKILGGYIEYIAGCEYMDYTNLAFNRYGYDNLLNSFFKKLQIALVLIYSISVWKIESQRFAFVGYISLIVIFAFYVFDCYGVSSLAERWSSKPKEWVRFPYTLDDLQHKIY